MLGRDFSTIIPTVAYAAAYVFGECMEIQKFIMFVIFVFDES